MRCRMEVISERADEYPSKRGMVKYIELVVLDTDREHRCKQTLDFRIYDEKQRVELAGKLAGKSVNIGVNDIQQRNGRIMLEGTLLEVEGLKSPALASGK